jgi:adenylate kinase family enzyme
MQRVSVVGTTGSGKSTFAERLAQAIDAQAIHLDDLMWLPDWQKRDDDEYTALLTSALQTERWVVDGNTRKSRSLVWNNADTVIWLNYSFWVNFMRLLLRTVQRIRKKNRNLSGLSGIVQNAIPQP